MASAPTDLSIRHVATGGGKRSNDGRHGIGDVTVIEFLDRRLIDAAHIEQLGEQIMEVINAAKTPRLVISFAKVEYLSSTTLNVLIEMENTIKRKGGQLRLANLDAELMKIFTIMKLHKVMKICKTTDEAVASLDV